MVSDPAFWEGLYERRQDGFDLRRETPVLARLLEESVVPAGARVAVPGCGRGHDARLLSRSGRPTWGFDFAPTAIAEARRLAASDFVAAGPDPAPLVFEERDVFTLPDAYPAAFDAVWEYTCFPAIDPARRPEYVEVLRRILVPGGRLVALFFPVDADCDGGPPFPSTREEIRRLLERGFRIDAAEDPADSVPSRRGQEWLVRATPSSSHRPGGHGAAGGVAPQPGEQGRARYNRPMPTTDLDLDAALAVARRAVSAAAEASLRHFRRGVAVETKPDRTPVTAADRDAEAAILAVIREAFPDHALLGEETGAHAGRADTRWIIDPLDGTRGFSRGGTFWGPLVALEHRGEVVVGAMALPALGETYWAARGMGAFRDGERLRVSGIGDWQEATLSLGEIGRLLEAPYAEGVIRLARSAASARGYGDLAGAMLVLAGRAEAWIECGVKPWDLAPIKVLVEEAGGRFTDTAGRPSVESGSAVATNGRVHEHVLAALGSR